MQTKSALNVICVSMQLFTRQTLRNTLSVFMKNLSHTYATFAKNVLLLKIHSKYTLKGFITTKSPSNLIKIKNLLFHIKTLEDILNV
jgi:arabinogalactan endo-1,4-beta-galactosidase